MALKLNGWRGVSMTFSYVHHFGSASGPIAPLTDCTLYFTVKEEQSDDSEADTTAIIKKTLTPANIPDAASGFAAFELTDDDMYIPVGKYYWDVIIEKNNRSQPPSCYGTFEIKAHPSNRQTLNG